jgi:cell wall-associated NlpC family hydrolase
VNSTELPAPSALRAAGVICALVSIAMLIGVPAGAAPTEAPQLSIAVDNGHTSTAAGDSLDTAITVRNLGTAEVAGLRVTQTMPPGLTFESADAAGAAGPDGVSWTVDLAPTSETVVRSTMTVSDTPPDLLRLATVACAATSGDGPPIVCASDSDQLPAGAAAEAALAADGSAAAADAASAVQLRWYLAGGAVLVVAAVAVLLLIRRRRRALHIARTTTVVALVALAALGTWSSTAPPIAAAPSGPAPAVATMGVAARTARTAQVATAAVPRRDLPVGGPVVAGPTGSAPATTTPVPQPEPGMQLAGFTSAAPGDRAAIAVTSALRQIGLPYVWGGDGPRSGDAGFDCSGLTTFAYATAGVALPRTAHTQYYAGPHLADATALLPGDLVFYGTPRRVHHVGMFIGQGRMVNAPTFGRPVQTAYYRWAGDDFLGSTRPAATGQPTMGLLPYWAPPADHGTSAAPGPAPVFLAPAAPPLPETVPFPATVPPVATDPGPPAAVATPGELAAPPVPAPGVVPAPDATEPDPTTAPTTTVPTTTVPTTTVPTTTAPTTTAPTTTAPTTTAPTTTAPTTTAPTTTPESPESPEGPPPTTPARP